MIEELIGASDFAVEDCAREGVVARVELTAVGAERARLTEGIDLLPWNDGAAEDLFCLGIALDNAAAGGFGDDETYRDGVEDGLEASFAGAQGRLGFFAVVDILDGAVPAHDLAAFCTTGRCAGPHPAPEAIAAADTVFDIDRFAGTEGDIPLGEGRSDVVWVQDSNPAVAERLRFGEAGELFPAMADVDDRAFGVGGPGDLRVQLDSVAVVIFTFGESFLGKLAIGDVDDGNGDADDLVNFVACRLEGD